MKHKADIIQRAYELIQCNAIVKATGRDYWQRIDRDLNVAYEIRLSSCTCNFYTVRNQGRELRTPCKHILSCFAAPVVRFIVKMRQCQTLDALMLLVNDEAPNLANELPEFCALANHEYHLVVGRLKNAPEQAEQQQQPVAKKVKQAKFKSRAVSRGGESLRVIQQQESPKYYGSIQIN